MSDQRPTRVRVTGPRRPVVRHRGRGQEIDDGTVLGTVLIDSLLRTQLRLALLTLAPLLLGVVAFPLLFHLAPSLAAFKVLGLPVPWLVLGILVYPLLFGLSLFYVRRAERNEREFSELVEAGEEP